MPASAGTPTIWDKIRVGFQALVGQAPTNATDAATLAGIQKDLNNDLSLLEGLFGPVVNQIETDAQTDVLSFLAGIAKAIPVGSVTSVSQITAAVLAAAKAIGGPINTQIGTIESSALNVLVGAAAVSAGHTNLTA
jgi:hypothetical protein